MLEKYDALGYNAGTMKTLFFALLAILPFTSSPSAQADEAAGQFVVFHTINENWPSDKDLGPEIQKHGRYWGQLTEFVEKGGPLSVGGGMMLLKPSVSEEKAKELAANDPAVKGGSFKAEVRFWALKVDNTVPPKAEKKNGLPFLIEKVDAAYIHTTKGSGLAKWYQEILGLDAGWGSDTWQEFKMPQASSTFAVDFLKGGSPVQNQSIIVSFHVDDIQAAVKHMLGKNVRFLIVNNSPIEDRPWGYLASFQDGDGNWMQLNQDKK